MSSPERFRDEVVEGPDGLRLRALSTDDVDAMVEACNDPLTVHWLPLPRPYTAEHARMYVERTAPEELSRGSGIVRAIEDHGRFAGVIDLKGASWRTRTVEIGYWVHPASRGRGLAGRAAFLLATWAMAQNDFHRVEVRVAVGNTGSFETARRAGFVPEGVLRSAGITHAGRVDLHVLSLVRGDVDWPRGEPIHP